MNILNLKPTHKVIKTYFKELQQLSLLDADKEGAVSPAFANLLRHCAKQFNWTLYEQYPLKSGTRNIYPDGALVDAFNLPYGYWEAKDIKDDLAKEVRKKFDAGYPKNNILFQTPQRVILYQDGRKRLDTDISQPDALIEILKVFFEYQPPQYEEWQQAVEAFKDEVPKLGQGLLRLIDHERRSNTGFARAFEQFTTLCQEAINPNIALQAVEEMLIQHLLTERIFSKVFDNPDFVNMNIVACEIEKVIRALVFPHGGRREFFKPLNRFYYAIETTATTISDFSQKQAFLDTVYEKFFQGFSVKIADTHGIVYTPQPIVKFMVNSIEEILQTEFGRSLSDEGVHILDPFVGTGNFIIHVMQKIRKTALPYKYKEELHCNEVMLLPYYIASMNIEHEYMSLTGEYKPFEGICLVDTFQLAEPAEQAQFTFMTEENTERVDRQKKAPIFVILGNPPYNVGQVNENDNNKNRTYPTMDQRVYDTYSKDSKATLKSQLRDPYVKAIRWASDRISDEGIVAFITNNSFVYDIPFDGMRKHLAQDFNHIYILDLKGNVRRDSMREGIPIGEQHTIFGLAAMVGIAVTFFVKNKQCEDYKIYYNSVDWKATRQEKFQLIEGSETYSRLKWKELTPDTKYNWLTEGMKAEFETFLPIGTKEAKSSKSFDVQTIFKFFSTGAKTNRDAWVYNFNRNLLANNMRQTIETYNHHVYQWQRLSSKQVDIDTIVLYDDSKISWSRDLKLRVKRGKLSKFDEEKIRAAMYRPFTKTYLFFDRMFADVLGVFPRTFPTSVTEKENRVICATNHSQLPFLVQMTNCIPDTAVGGRPGQCFPFYTYDEDGSNRQENLTDWALEQFRTHYNDDTITKWNIFHYVYAILHQPQYREKYAANLRRELPRIPFVKSPFGGGQGEVFRAFAKAGKKLADLHVNYEQQPKYPLKFIEKEGEQLDWRVEKMKLSKDKKQIVYNHFLTLDGIPPETFEYRLGNKSALHWIIDQYRVKTDKRSGIVNDPNRADEPDYIVNLIQRVIAVSVETVKIVKALPALEETTNKES